MFKFEDLLFFPKDVRYISNTKKRQIIAWIVVSFIFFHMVSFPSIYRAAWIMYVIGMFPVMIAFSNKKYVKSTLKQEFSSLVYVLYKNNILVYLFRLNKLRE